MKKWKMVRVTAKIDKQRRKPSGRFASRFAAGLLCAALAAGTVTPPPGIEIVQAQENRSFNNKRQV